jgi:hypothetical protein
LKVACAVHTPPILKAHYLFCHSQKLHFCLAVCVVVGTSSHWDLCKIKYKICNIYALNIFVAKHFETLNENSQLKHHFELKLATFLQNRMQLYQYFLLVSVFVYTNVNMK